MSRRLTRSLQLAALGAGLLIYSSAPAQDTSTTDEQFETFVDQPPAGILLESIEGGAREVLRAGIQLRAVYRKGINEIKISEGFVPRLYNDAAGFCTIGFGHLIKKARCNGTEPAEFRDGLTDEEGERRLIQDVRQAQIAVLNAVRVPLTDGQYAALVSFTFNVGGGNLRGSTLLRVVNARQFDRVPGQFRRWTRAGGRVFRGLVTRREREIALFFDGQPIPRAAPRPDEVLTAIDIETGEAKP